MRPSAEIKLNGVERSELQRLTRGRKVWRALSDRAHIVLLAAEGLNNLQIANTLGINNLTTRKWHNRFAEHGMDGLQDEPRPGRPRRINDDAVAEVVRKTLEEKPRDATHWSTHSMSRETGYAPSTIHRIWQAFSLRPHRRPDTVRRYRSATSSSGSRTTISGSSATSSSSTNARRIPHPA